jgi:hypothetical protein
METGKTMNKRLLEQTIENCRECPYIRWQADISESNHNGYSLCVRAIQVIEWDNKRPSIPKWCPLSKVPKRKKQ